MAGIICKWPESFANGRNQCPEPESSVRPSVLPRQCYAGLNRAEKVTDFRAPAAAKAGMLTIDASGEISHVVHPLESCGGSHHLRCLLGALWSRRSRAQSRECAGSGKGWGGHAAVIASRHRKKRHVSCTEGGRQGRTARHRDLLQIPRALARYGLH